MKHTIVLKRHLNYAGGAYYKPKAEATQQTFTIGGETFAVHVSLITDRDNNWNGEWLQVDMYPVTTTTPRDAGTESEG